MMEMKVGLPRASESLVNEKEVCISLVKIVITYTRLDKIRSGVIRKELEISGIQDVRAKYKKTGTAILKEWKPPDFETHPQLQT
jgi:hypothetical protein